LIGDGVVPGNTGRNYVCRMIIRRAARFGSKIGLNEAFMARVAAILIENYGDFYPELAKNKTAILDNLTREEERFQRTVEAGMGQLQDMLDGLKAGNLTVLNGRQAFDLYATHGLPLELTRDIAREQGLEVDQEGFRAAMEDHKVASGAGKAFGPMGGEDVDVYRGVLADLLDSGQIGKEGVSYDPYSTTEVETTLLAMVRDGSPVQTAEVGDRVEVILSKTCFYVESGGQVSDNGLIVSATEPGWEIAVEEMRKPAAGVISHVGRVTKGQPSVKSVAIATVDINRRQDIRRNHTATHLLHAVLHEVLGDHARQAGSLVSPDHFRFDFTHPEGMTAEQVERAEAGVNAAVMANYQLTTVVKPLQEAIAEGAMALFGEKYGDTVRTVNIGGAEPFSYELCGGTHVSGTGDIGLFLILSESSAAAGVRRIEAVTGRKAYELVVKRFRLARQSAAQLECSLDELPGKVASVLEDLSQTRKSAAGLRQEVAVHEFERKLVNTVQVAGVTLLAAQMGSTDADTLRLMTDRFRQQNPSGVVLLASAPDGKPVLIAAVTEDLIKRGLHAGDLVKRAAQIVGGNGGGRPNLASAGGKDAAKISEALDQAAVYIKEKIK
jgi:alanyl-tRNA synthetase